MNKSTWESTVKPVVVLSVIALVVSFLLALVNSFTAPIIEENQKAATLAAYVDVMPPVSDAKTLEEVTDYTTENVTGVVKAEDGSIAIKAEEKGFDGGILTVIMGYDTNGTVTADWSADGLASGKGAYKVNDRVVVALNTATPLYRDLKTGDKGDDVLALNNELSRLGYNSVAGSDTYWWATSDGWRQLMNDNGNPSDGTLALADTMWIPENAVAVDEWTATTGSMVTGGTAIGKIPGALTKLTVKNGTAVGQDRTISMYGVNGILPADSTEITDAEFLRNVSASETFQSMDMQTKKAGLDATVALKEPLQVLRVPAGAVFGIDGSSGCIVPKSHNASNTPAKVTIVGSELGVSLVQTQDADVSAIANVEIGSGLNGLVCK